MNIIKIYVVFCFLFTTTFSIYGEEGITETEIRLASVLALKGNASGLGKGMRKGLEAALQNKQVQGKNIRLIFKNDFYEPQTTIKETNNLIRENIFLMIGNVGTPTAKVSLPILKQKQIPAVGFFTGAGLLRPGNGGPIVNYRASYIQETAAVIDAAISNGIKTSEICAYLQNDAYGMAGLTGIHKAMKKHQASQKILNIYKDMLNMQGENPKRNGKGPIGVYPRNRTGVKSGYDSLKKWETENKVKCKLVITVGAYKNIAKLIRYASKNNEKWIFSAVSFTGADNFLTYLKRYNASSKIIMTQVVPLLNSNLPIVQEAKRTLGKKLGFVSLEGYIVGKITLEILKNIQGEITRKKFMEQVKKTNFTLGGLKINFQNKELQASNLVIISYATKTGYKKANQSFWNSI